MSGFIVTGKGIDAFRLKAMQGRLKIEAAGMKFRGPSTLSMVKSEFGLKGNREKVMAQFDEIVEKELAKINGEGIIKV